MGKLVSAAGRAAKIAGMAALIGVSLAEARGMAAPPASSAVPPNVVTDLAADRSAKLPMLSDERTAAVQLLWFDPLDALPAGAEEALAEEVRSIFRGLGVEVAFRTAGPETTYGDGPVPEVPVILLRDDPVHDRRSRRVLGLVVRDHEPNRAVWTFLENVTWTLGQEQGRLTPSGEIALGVALGRVVAHEVIHAIAPDEPHTKKGLMGHTMSRAFLLSERAPLEDRCGRAFLSGLAARTAGAPGGASKAAVALVR
jgi:hypothetical protein